jgi:hypothetical protein
MFEAATGVWQIEQALTVRGGGTRIVQKYYLSPKLVVMVA